MYILNPDLSIFKPESWECKECREQGYRPRLQVSGDFVVTWVLCPGPCNLPPLLSFLIVSCSYGYYFRHLPDQQPGLSAMPGARPPGICFYRQEQCGKIFTDQYAVQ